MERAVLSEFYRIKLHLLYRMHYDLINHPAGGLKTKQPTTDIMKLQIIASAALALLSAVPGVFSEVSYSYILHLWSV